MNADRRQHLCIPRRALVVVVVAVIVVVVVVVVSGMVGSSMQTITTDNQ